MAVASLVCGIVSIVFAGWVGIVPGIVAIVLGILAKQKETENQKFAKAGFILGIIGASLSIVIVIACYACAAAITSAANEETINAINAWANSL